eukprot:scaffold22740_cov139-Cylindrotheca_fusiformis.AAC.2
MSGAVSQDTREKEIGGFEIAFDSFHSDHTSWSDSDDESLLEIEERLLEFSHVGCTPALAGMVFNTSDFKVFFPTKPNSGGSVSSGRVSTASETKLTKNQEKSLEQFGMRRSNSDQCIQKESNTAAPLATDDADMNVESQGMKPQDCLKNILDEQGITVPHYSKEFVAEYMLQMGPENYEAYGRDIANAVRSGDLDGVKDHVKSGKTLQCCNKFQESILHLVCRRGYKFMLEYMLEETDVSPCIQDDIGRTPLHELAWTDKPNFEMVKLILKRYPELLYIKDSRGFSPLSYVGGSNWGKWCGFLEENREILAPAKL